MFIFFGVYYVLDRYLFLVQTAAILKLELPREADAACQLEVLGIKRPWSTVNKAPWECCQPAPGSRGCSSLGNSGLQNNKVSKRC